MVNEGRHLKMRHPAMTVSISTSNSPDLETFGLSETHLKEAMAEIALQLLAIDMDLAYGGDLRQYGFSQLLFQLVLRYTSNSDLKNHRIRVTNHLAWPVHIEKSVDQLDALEKDLHGAAKLTLLEQNGKPMSMDHRRTLSSRIPSHEEWSSGLTAMRKFQSSSTDARVLLGGQVSNFKGRMPGVAEEALLSLNNRKPLYLIGGFGGCTRDIAEALGLVRTWNGSRNSWPYQKEFERWRSEDLNNGLSKEENEVLADSPSMENVIVLVLRGVLRLRKQKCCHTNGL